METQHLKVETKTPKSDQVNLGDEKTKIIEDFTPDKVRADISPLPQVNSNKETQ